MRLEDLDREISPLLTHVQRSLALEVFVPGQGNGAYCMGLILLFISVRPRLVLGHFGARCRWR